MKYILFLGEAGQQDLPDIGVKGLGLARMFKAGFKVPPGFIISKEVCDFLFSKKEVKLKIVEVLRAPHDRIREKAEELKKLILEQELKEDVIDEIIEAYLSLSVDLDMNAASLLETKEVFVAVRSSYLNEIESSELRQKTVLNVKGKERLFKAILKCYAALFNPELIEYQKETKKYEFSTALIVQKMVDSDKSGVAYSMNPERRGEILVNACFGLGEGIVSGKVIPDKYFVDRRTLTLKDVKIGEKQYEYTRDIDTDETISYKLGSKSTQQVLYDKDIIEIARITKKIVNVLGKEQKIEWAMKKDAIYVLQTKDLRVEEPPETVEMEITEEEEEQPEIIDITEKDFEDDLQVLEEIENIEKQEEKPVEVKEDVVIEPVMDKPIDIQKEPVEEKEETTEYVVFGDIETPNDEPEKEQIETDEGPVNMFEEYGDDESSEEEPVVEQPQPVQEQSISVEHEEEIVEEEKVKDDSIFSDYKFDSFSGTKEEEEEKPKQVDLHRLRELAQINSGNVVVYAHMVVQEKLKQKLKQYVREIPDDFGKLLSEVLEYENLGNEEELRKLNNARDAFIIESKYPSPDEVQLALRLV